MSEKEKAQAIEPDIDVFTSEIEDTIDDLFTPKKKIEIDPLTQEVKVIDADQEGAGQAAAKGQEPEIALAPDETAGPTAEQTPVSEADVVETSDLDLEIELEEPPAQEEARVEGAVEAAASGEETGLEVEPELVLEPEIAPEAESADSAGEPVATKDAEEDKADLEMEPDIALELEPEAAEQKAQAAEGVSETDTAAVVEDAASEPTTPLERIEEIVFTLEWEVKQDQVQEAKRLLKELPGAYPPARLASNLVASMTMVLEKMTEAPDELDAGAPVLLKEAVALLKNGEGLDETQAAQLSERLSSMVRVKEPGQQADQQAPDLGITLKPEPMPEPLMETEETSSAEETTSEPEGKDTAATAPVVTPEPVSAETGPVSPVASVSEDAQEVVRQHLHALKGCIAKILPVEQVLRDKPGAEKMYRFQAGIRRTLEEEYNRLSRHFFGTTEEFEAVAPISGEVEEGGATPRCPWTDLRLVTVGGKAIAFPADQLALVARPGIFGKGAVKKAETIQLSRLKAWPWSKLAPNATGPFSDLDEKAIGETKAQVLHQVGEIQLDPSGDFVAVVLSSGGRTVVLLADGEPTTASTEGYSWHPGQDGLIQGRLEKDGQTMHILALK